MFGFNKKKVQLRSVEDYLRTQAGLNADGEHKPPKGGTALPRVKSLVGPILGILFILLLVAAALSQFNGLRSEIAGVKSQEENDTKGLDQQVAELKAEADKTENRAALLTENVASLEKALDAERSERMAAEERAKRSAAAAALRARKAAKRTSAAAFKKASPVSGR